LIPSDLNTESIVKMVRTSKAERDQAIKLLYFDEKIVSDISRIVHTGGGDKADVKVVHSEALMQFVKTAVGNTELVINGSLRGYILGIAKFVWYKKATKQARHRVLDVDEQHDVTDGIAVDDLVIKTEKAHLLQDLLSKMGETCKEVLMHWAHGFKMAEIASMIGYSGEAMAKKKKYQCMKKLLTYIADHPHIKEALR